MSDDFAPALHPFPPCGCRRFGADPAGEVDRLRELVAAGFDQHEASMWLWAGKTMPVRAWVRDQFRQAFPWLTLPPMGVAR